MRKSCAVCRKDYGSKGGLRHQVSRPGSRQPTPFNLKFCATPKICKKLCSSLKIVDFTAFFSKFLSAQSKTYNVAKHLHNFLIFAPLFWTLDPGLHVQLLSTQFPKPHACLQSHQGQAEAEACAKRTQGSRRRGVVPQIYIGNWGGKASENYLHLPTPPAA